VAASGRIVFNLYAAVRDLPAARCNKDSCHGGTSSLTSGTLLEVCCLTLIVAFVSNLGDLTAPREMAVASSSE